MEVEFDQHFMDDEEILNLIIDSSKINYKDIIFEIGPGLGSLTRKILQKRPLKLISVEKDSKLEQEFEITLKENNNFELIISDGIKELDNHIFTKLIANIPYSITEPLYSKILDLKLNNCILLHGRDFAKNIIIRETKWNYFINSFYNVEEISEIEGNKFNPPTKVKSSLIRLKLKNNLSNIDIFYQTLWNKRKRSTYNSLIYSLVDSCSLSKTEAKLKLKNFNISISILNKKLENLSNMEFNKIVEFINSIIEP